MVQDVRYEDVLTLIGFGRIHYLLLLTSGMLVMMPLNETMGMGMIVVAAKCDFIMNVEKIAITTTAPFLGMITSAYFWGYMCDLRGRRKILLISTFGANISSVLSIFMTHYWFFVVLRFTTGLFLAGPASIPITYLSEFCTKKNSVQVINWMAAFTGVSMVYCPSIGMYLLTSKWAIPVCEYYNFTPWRLQILLYMLPGLIGALILIALPESPKYLYAVGKEEEGKEALEWLCKKSTGKDLEEVLDENDGTLRPSISLYMEVEVFKLKVFWDETVPIFHKPNLKNFLLSCFLMFGILFLSNGMGLWYPTIRGFHRIVIAEVGFAGGTFCNTFFITKHDPFAETRKIVKCTSVNAESALDSICLGITYLVCFTLQGISLGLIGRKKTMMSVFTLGCICVLAIYFSHINDINLLLFLFCLFLALPAISISMLASGVVSFTPTRQRAKAVCLVFMFGRVGAVIGAYTFLNTLDNYCDTSTLLAFGYYLGGIVILYILPI